MATAMIPRTRAGSMREENSGARKNSGVIRARTRMNPASSVARELGEQLADHEPTSEGIEMYRLLV